MTIASGVSLAGDSATIDVRIQVLPIAVVDFPEGADFTLRVPHTPHCPPLMNGGRWLVSTFWGHSWEADWRRWSDDDWDDWGVDYSWEDWESDTFRNSWYVRCRTWLSERYWPVVRPVRIPFSVRGNALASVSVAPDSYIRIRSGRWLGRARGSRGRTLGYDTILHFPVPSNAYRWQSGWDLWDEWDNWRGWRGFGSLPWWSRWTHLPGAYLAGTPQLTADMQQRAGKAFGVIYVVARRNWTTDGKKARPDDYNGSLDVTIVPANE